MVNLPATATSPTPLHSGVREKVPHLAKEISSTERAKRSLQQLHKAADVAEENSRHALEAAQRLSHQLRAAEERIAELEADVEAYRDRAERAEQWLDRIHGEIEGQFLRRDDASRRAPRAAGHGG